MTKRIPEQTIIFISILKWFALASCIGVIVGLSTTVFLKILMWGSEYAGQYSYYFLLMPVTLFLTSMMVRYLAPDAEGHGTEKVIEAIHKHSGKIKPAVVPIKLVTTVMTIASGGSAGKEGPCAQIGAGLSSSFATLLKFDDRDRRKLVICGISAGFASVFGTPIAGAIFGTEVLFVGGILYDVLLPSFVAGITSYQVSSALGISYFHHTVELIPVFSEAFFAKIVIAGILFGMCSFLLIEGLHLGKKLSGKLHVWDPWKGALGGFVLIGLTFVFSRQFLGLGLETIEPCLQGREIIWYAFLVKIVFTSVTLNFGGSGGIITPIFFVGATAGAVYAEILKLDIGTFSAIGMVSLLAGAANTPVSASIMGVELFGPKIAPYAAVACVISFLMTGHRSVYPSQVLSVKKSASIRVEMGKEIDHIETEFHPRRKSLIWFGVRALRRLKPKAKE